MMLIAAPHDAAAQYAIGTSGFFNTATAFFGLELSALVKPGCAASNPRHSRVI